MEYLTDGYNMLDINEYSSYSSSDLIRSTHCLLEVIPLVNQSKYLADFGNTTEPTLRMLWLEWFRNHHPGCSRAPPLPVV